MPHFREKFLLVMVVLFYYVEFGTGIATESISNQTTTQAEVLKLFRDINDAEVEYWQGDNPCDNWSGIICSESGDITSIEYRYRPSVTRLIASIPPQFSLLKQLKKIQFDGARIFGKIPPELSTLEFIEEFNIRDHEIQSGSIPPELSTWKNIKIVDLEAFSFEDSITGTLPPELSEWSALEKLNLYDNENVGGTLPVQYSTWYNIKNISLYDNFIVGTLPVQQSTWANIQYISLYANNIAGTLPVEYSAWGTVSYVSFEDNALNGTLPVQYSTWDKVSYVSFESNILTGAVPIEYSQWRNFTKLMFSQNFVFGDSLCITDYLAGLFLKKDNTNIYKLPDNSYDNTYDYTRDDDYDTIDDSKVTDVLSLPTCFSSNPEAEALQQFKNSLDDRSLLSSWQGDDPCNQWRGITCTGNNVTSIEYTDGCCEYPIIPRQFSNLKLLKQISISNADVRGTIPPELSLLEDIEVFQIQNHELFSTAKIPRELSTWKKLQIFDVEADFYFIGDVLPVELSEWRELRVFDINNNKINGSLPVQYSTWVNIQYLSVQNNELAGKLPVQYSTWANAQYLNFSNNNISGSVPQQYSFWDISTVLRLYPQKQNNLCIQDFFAGQLTSIEKKLNTDVSKLPICNILPNTSSNSEANSLLQFGSSVQDQTLFNSWKGDDPCTDWRGITCTQNNNVSIIEYTYPKDAATSIPPEFSALQYLKNIIFNRDGITGTIPPELSVLDIIEFQIYEQQMQGTLPVQLSTWKNIQTFNLKGLTSVGQLTGLLPEQFSEWTNLNYFDVGNNDLSGTLPVQLSTWYNVSYIDLSGNEFTGSVPEGYSIWNSQSGIYLADQEGGTFVYLLNWLIIFMQNFRQAILTRYRFVLCKKAVSSKRVLIILLEADFGIYTAVQNFKKNNYQIDFNLGKQKI